MAVSSLIQVEFQGYYPGVVGKIAEIHAIYYHQHWGLDVSFETQVARELSEFVRDFQKNRDGLWVASGKDGFVGSIAIDGRQASNAGARLRWFIVVSEFQGAGIGKALLARAIEFCRSRGYERVFLWSFKGLEAARRIYELHGFRLRQERDVTQWGRELREQMFQLAL